MLRYWETNWKFHNGFDTRRYAVTTTTICTSKTRREQRAKVEKISLVAFLNNDQKKILAPICKRLKHDDHHFYQNNNLHVTLFGFGPLEKKVYERILEKIRQFSIRHRVKKVIITFDSVRPGTMYSENRTLNPVQQKSNGTVIAIGDVAQNHNFCNYTNKLTLFLLKDEEIGSALGPGFRRKFPTVWCTLGYYNKNTNFSIGYRLEKIFKQYSCLNGNDSRFTLSFPISEITLVKSKYKNLRYPKVLRKFQI